MRDYVPNRKSLEQPMHVTFTDVEGNKRGIAEKK